LSLQNNKWLIIEIAASILLFFASNSLDKDNVPKKDYRSEIQISIIAEGKALDPRAAEMPIETHVREYFADTPILSKIAYCESRFRHFKENGEVLRGEITPEDIGVMQINEYYHGDTAKRLGINIYTLEGNLAYAKWLYEKEGVAPWIYSKKCWSQLEHIAKI